MKIFDLTNEHIEEAPIQMDPSEPNNPTVYGHEKANPMTLKGRIMSARAQLKELAKMADSDDLAVWQQITKLAKGGMFMGLEQNFEQIRHGIGELAKKRKKGGIGSRGISKNIGEQGVEEVYDGEPDEYHVLRHRSKLDIEREITNPRLWEKIKQFDGYQAAKKAYDEMKAKYPNEKFTVTTHKKKGIGETATSGATSAGNVASVSNKQSNPTKKGKHGAPEAPQHKNKDGTVKNALNTNDNLFGGKTVKR